MEGSPHNSSRKGLLQKVQELPGDKKERLVRVILVVIAILVVGIWLWAFPAATHLNDKGGEAKGFSLAETMKSGAAALSGNILNAIKGGKGAQ